MTKPNLFNSDFDPLNELMLHKNQIEQINNNVMEVARAHNQAATDINNLSEGFKAIVQSLKLQQEEIRQLKKHLANCCNKATDKTDE